MQGRGSVSPAFDDRPEEAERQRAPTRATPTRKRDTVRYQGPRRRRESLARTHITQPPEEKEDEGCFVRVSVPNFCVQVLYINQCGSTQLSVWPGAARRKKPGGKEKKRKRASSAHEGGHGDGGVSHPVSKYSTRMVYVSTAKTFDFYPTVT